MSKNLVIVESPAKAKTIEKFLGKDYKVKSSMGHVRDLPEKTLGIDVKNNFAPLYEILKGKSQTIADLKKDVNLAEMVWLATDEDREGEAISWHLMKVLELPEEKIRRIAFHEITKSAILHAIEHPRALNIDLVDAQQARRVLDRLVGFELSPVLWKKVKPALSAGRVQSVAVRLIVEREKEINGFQSTSAYRVVGDFLVETPNGEKVKVQGELNKRFEDEQSAEDFLQKCIGAAFTVDAVETNPAKRTPAPPFTTSTLQQEASRKLGFSVSKTMTVAQQLYEAGYITYMRTDSVNLSDTALADTNKEINSLYGKEYAKIRKYTTKTKGAQEAHEAIRPSYIAHQSISVQDAAQKRLYELIWKRTIASQMSDAKFEKTTVSVLIDKAVEKFVVSGEVLLFDGFLKVYLESKDDEDDAENQAGKLPVMQKGMLLNAEQIQATQRFTRQPPRYTEASLVSKLEELGIGRPSTYAPIISTIQKRQYVLKGDKEGFEREYSLLTLKKEKIAKTVKKEKVANEKGKLLPTDIGGVVNNFLVNHFEQIMNYQFTADIEKEFDDIAEGKIKWEEMIRRFYGGFNEVVKITLETSEKASGERLLGVHPTLNKNVYAKLARYGPVVQIGDSNSEDKLQFSSLLSHQSIDTVTFEEALALFDLPRIVGKIDDEELLVNNGRFGPYVRYKGKFYSIPKTENVLTIDTARCLEIMAKKEERDAQRKPILIGNHENEELSAAVGRYGPYVSYKKKFYALPAGTDISSLTMEDALKAMKEVENKNVIKKFSQDEELKVMKGKFGPYISRGRDNFRIPKDETPEDLTYEECLEIIEQQGGKGKKRK
ncbi:MAG: type I DNA topoisomerase [Lentimicrobiaceae bacterium]|nr:type I DNA topoisomerase [Lentimicrobiaceae bacterium]